MCVCVYNLSYIRDHRSIQTEYHETDLPYCKEKKKENVYTDKIFEVIFVGKNGHDFLFASIDSSLCSEQRGALLLITQRKCLSGLEDRPFDDREME